MLTDNEKQKIKSSLAIMFNAIGDFGISDKLIGEVEKVAVAECESLAYKFYLMGKNEAMQEVYDREHPRYKVEFPKSNF